MKKTPALFVVALALALATSSLAGAWGRDELSFTTSIDDDNGRILGCSDIEMQFYQSDRGRDEIVTVRRDRIMSIEPHGSAPLRIEAPQRGGILVQPATDGKYSVLVCTAAGATSRDKGERILDRVDASFVNGELSVSGPVTGDWSAYLVISVPRSVDMDLRAENGAIGIRDVNGRLDARTKNGPIAFRGSAGDVRLVAENGPIKVRLTSPTWSGKGLDASTQNGPVKLVVPQGLRSGVRVTGSEHSPMKWGDGLGRVYKGVMGSDGQGFTLGREPVVIRLSTVNGPIDVTTTGKGKGSTRI